MDQGIPGARDVAQWLVLRTERFPRVQFLALGGAEISKHRGVGLVVNGAGELAMGVMAGSARVDHAHLELVFMQEFG
jgi:hypothetical protein